MHLPDSPPDGGDAAMTLAVPAAAEDRLATVMPARAKARTFLQRSDPSPEPRDPLGPVWANLDGEVAMPRQQLPEAHGRAGALWSSVAQAMGMLQERGAWWRSAAAVSIEERAVLLEQAEAQEVTLLGQMKQIGQALQHLSTDATFHESHAA